MTTSPSTTTTAFAWRGCTPTSLTRPARRCSPRSRCATASGRRSSSRSRSPRRARGATASRGRISYAQLGINQLGAVYEGLLTYSGFFAQERLYEVKPAGADPAKEDVQTYFITGDQLDRYEPDEFVYEETPGGVRRRKQYERGRFIFRLAGRDREKSASYYTPEVLTRCVVKYSLKELLPGLTADEILKLTVCEPAMGSGAFINEALNQLADAYLERKQAELGERIPPDALPGGTAEGQGLSGRQQRLRRRPQPHGGGAGHGLHLAQHHLPRRARALVFGAAGRGQQPDRRTPPGLLGRRDAERRLHQSAPPTPCHSSQERPAGSVYHWLLPDKGMAAFDRDKVIKELAPEAVEAIKEWRKGFTKKISRDELKALQGLSERIDVLWAEHTRQRITLLARTHTDVAIWGQPPITSPQSPITPATKSAELAALFSPTSAYRRLKLVMDYWCALWFWPINEAEQLPTRAQYLSDLDSILLSEETGFEVIAEQLALYDAIDQPETAAGSPAGDESGQALLGWEERGELRQRALGDLKVSNVDELAAEIERLALVAGIAVQQRFHHWELVFAEVFAERGGFDLILGNPPWVKLSFDETGVFSEYEPLVVIRKMRRQPGSQGAPKGSD